MSHNTEQNTESVTSQSGDDDEEIVGGQQRFEELQKQLAQLKKSSKSNITTTTAEPVLETSDQQEATIKNQSSRQDIFDPFGRFQSTGDMKHDYRRGGPSVQDTGKNTVRCALDCKKTYLFIYNLVMFVMFLMVFLILIIKTITKTIDDDSIRGAAFLVKILTYTQLLESIHPMIGLVPGGPFMPFLQAIGRLVVNHFLTDDDIRLQAGPSAQYLFLVWTCIEIFRYSFYALRVFKVQIYPITWCRYSLFLPLYPMGGYFESQVIFATIKQYEKTGAYSVSLPNSANFSFDVPLFLKFYTFVLLGPSIYYLMRYMWSQRCKQLAAKKEKLE